MNYFLKLKSITFILLAAFLITGCSSDSNDEIGIDPGDGDGDGGSQFDGELTVFNTGNDNRTVTINGSTLTGANATVKVSFKSENTMRRLYVTQDVNNFGAEPYNFALAGVTVDDKKDGSLDLSSDNGDEFEFAIPFPAPTSSDSKIVYTLWATTGRGDFRDVSKRNAIDAIAVGTITINGSGNTVSSGLHSFSDVKLSAPTGDGQSMTFFSLFTGEVSKINPYMNPEQNSELVEIWDFGYYYTPNGDEFATLASVQAYELPGVDIAAISGIDRADFNRFYLKKSETLTTADFDSATTSDLSALSVDTSAPEKLNKIEVNDIIEFVDKYGNKGLIKVNTIDLGNSGNGFDADAFMTIDIKVLF